jgi:collagenase-like PrtC family protease
LKISVATNWSDQLIENMIKDDVVEVFGKLESDFFGGGRASFSLPSITKSNAQRHVECVHENGLEFNYLLNSTCLGNKEFSRSGQKKMVKLLDWLCEIEIDTVTVSIPYIFMWIKKKYPDLKINVSTWADVDTIERLKYWNGLGANAITLPAMRLIRDFPLLRQMRKAADCKLQLIANEKCIRECPHENYHKSLLSHSSQSDHDSGGFLIDYCFFQCSLDALKDKSSIIRGSWIRPEDIKYYEKVGIDRIKLVDRRMADEQILKIVKAYTERRYDGNLLDLFNRNLTKRSLNRYSIRKLLKYQFRPLRVNPLKQRKLAKKLTEIDIYVDNKKLDGFINHFLDERCGMKSCSDCGYCEGFAEKAVKINSEQKKAAEEGYQEILDELTSGEMFGY